MGLTRSTEPRASASHPSPCCKDLAKDIKIKHRELYPSQVIKRRDRKADQAIFMQDVVKEVQNQRKISADGVPAISQVDGEGNSGFDIPARNTLAWKPHDLSLGDATNESDFQSYKHTGNTAGDGISDTESESDSGSDFSVVSFLRQGDGPYENEPPQTAQRKDSVDRAETPNFPPSNQTDAAGDKLATMHESGPSAKQPTQGVDDDKAGKNAEKHQRSRDHVRYEKHLQSEEHQKGDLDERHALSREHQKFIEHSKVHEELSIEKQKKPTSQNPVSGLQNPAVAQVTAAPYGSSPATADTTGNPFLRSHPFSRTKSPVTVQDDSDSCHDDEDHSGRYPGSQHRGQSAGSGKETVHSKGCKATKSPKHCVEVPVGICRLHLVKLPTLQMMPIYWSRLHDVSAVTRGTWFHKDTMLPVEPTVANQLEKGYRLLRPWSQTWKDELKSALDVGAAGEEKISHRLWPKETPAVRKDVSPSSHDISTNPHCAAICFNGQAAATGSVDTSQNGEPTPNSKPITKRYPNSHVIYKDAQDAYILKTSLQPSAYYGRRPLAKIMKNTTVGISVTRGFDWTVWDKLHPPKKVLSQKKAQEIGIPQSGNAEINQAVCMACRNHEERPKVTDLVLVCHGIGQKLSERVESFHFTHAINGLRRAVNVEVANDAVQKVFREDLGGVMVLPVNWREGLSLEDGGPSKDSDQMNADPTSFNLKDITPESIPAVRGFISDVMLDIPFYMSQHKPTMIRALIKESNRIFRLWCANNPEFQKEGRMHFVGHSLGSVMLMEALSKQPTFVTPGKLDLRPHKIQHKYFDFDCQNLFVCGSPAAFFLLLDKARLMPRAGRNKPGAEPGDDDIAGITSETPQLGCLAVNNIYNIIHPNDPIAYRLNATIDPVYAQSLKTAQVPSSATSILSYMGKAVSSFIPGKSAPANTPIGELAPSKSMMERLPSQLEMEVHDFSREEIAEKKAYRLNDNGQIDYFLNPGSGTIEYLNMLGAHSSYWTSNDFVRLLVTETGRRMGPKGTLPNMRAMKLGPVVKKQEKYSGVQ